MTTPATGPISLLDLQNEFGGTAPISFSEYYRGAGFVPALLSELPAAGAIDLNNFRGKNKITGGNSGILTGGSSFTLPITSGPQVKILAIGGGGGGGGGSSRTAGWSGYDYGGGGGGGADIRLATVTVTPGQSISYSIGGAGAAGGPRDGRYEQSNPGSPGGAGATTVVNVNGTNVVIAPSGKGGTKSGTGAQAGGAAGSGGTGTQPLTPNAGASTTNNKTGGVGARGYTINATVGAATPYGYGTTGAGGVGGSGTRGQTGTVYGAGGGGGGTNPANDVAGDVGGPGSAGAVFIWWGY